MQAPTISQALAAWERGTGRGAVERSLELFAIARPDAPLDALADACLGERDGALFELREAMFGPELSGRFSCAACGEQQEINLNLSDLKSTGAHQHAPLSLSSGDYALELRLLTSRDMLAAAAVPFDEGRILLERSVISASREGESVQTQSLPPCVVDDIARTLADADPDADLKLNMACSNCGHETRMTFDIGTFLWEEVDAWADRMLREVHTLAASYGWTERDILELSPQRRRRYLELASA
ncbi:MAG TPA: hypothetical protein VGH23_01985 [Rhizomicrobium sp.]|jgi:hypothetical protein|nr:hypothetical protein [Acetobacteraceae bacterium]